MNKIKKLEDYNYYKRNIIITLVSTIVSIVLLVFFIIFNIIKIIDLNGDSVEDVLSRVYVFILEFLLTALCMTFFIIVLIINKIKLNKLIEKGDSYE